MISRFFGKWVEKTLKLWIKKQDHTVSSSKSYFWPNDGPQLLQTTRRREDKIPSSDAFAGAYFKIPYRAGFGLLLATTAVASYNYGDKIYPEYIVRWSRSTWACIKICADYKFSTWPLVGLERQKQLHVIHLRSARTLLDLFKVQGGIYVKAGQHMSSLNYLLPQEFCSVLSELHFKAATSGYEQILTVLEQDLGVHPSKYFDKFDPVPIAAASIAQVHHAVKDGKDVAVKVQFLDVGRLSKNDVRTIEFITNLISFIFPNLKFNWLVREFDNNLPLELDFVNEANNANRMRELFKGDPYFCTPKIYHATKRVLIMEWIEGKHINDISGLRDINADPNVVVMQLNRIFNDQIFKHRFVHCDPHAGNIIVRKSDKNRHKIELCLLDNGLYREYSKEFSLSYAKLWIAILKQHEQVMEQSAQEMGVVDYRLFVSMITARSWNHVVTTLYSGMGAEESRQIKSQVAERAADITSILATVPSPLLLLLKTNDLLRIINHQLGASPIYTLRETLYACNSIIHSSHVGTESATWVSLRRAWERWKLFVKLSLLEWLLILKPIFWGWSEST